MWLFRQDSRENSANVPFAGDAEGDYEGHLGGTDCRGTRLRRWFWWAIMSSSCRSRSILEKLTTGLSTLKCRDAVREFREAYGLEKDRHQLARTSLKKW
jgi:hypothetical protein